MKKAATLTLSVALVITVIATAMVQAQVFEDVAPDAAAQEAVRRQAMTIELRQKLAEAQASQQRNDTTSAGKQYQAAYELTQKIGTGVEAETKAAAAGLAWVATERVKVAQQQGNFRAAAIHLNSALRADPKDPELLALKKENDARLAGQAGKYPSDEVLDRIPSAVTNQARINTLVQDGRLLFEMGKLDEAQAKLTQATKEDPENAAAFHYLRLIQEARLSNAVRKREMDSDKRIVEIADAWQSPVKRESLPVPNSFARTNLVNTSLRRQTIYSKMDHIMLNEVKYDGLELSEVVKNLAEESRKRDPEKTGINFLILANGNPTARQATATDQNLGLQGTEPLPLEIPEQVDLSAIRVKLNPPLHDVRLVDVLDAVVRTAEIPAGSPSLTYSVEDYAVVFSLKAPEQLTLYTRTFKVDPNTFYSGLEGVSSASFGNLSTSRTGGGGNNRGGGQNLGQGQVDASSASGVPRASATGISFVTAKTVNNVQDAVRAFFTAAGVDLAPPKAVFFNDRKGQLFVRATLQDLDVIEAAIQTLNVTPPQVNIRARFAEISQNDSRALGFDWYMGNTKLGGGVYGQAGTAPSFNGSDPGNGITGSGGTTPSTIFPNPIISQAATDTLLTGGLRNAAPTLATITGILTEPQFRVAINALEQRDGVDLLSAPEVTTLSGRQAQIQVVDNRTIVTGLDANQTSSSSGYSTTGTAGGGGVGSIIQPDTQTMPFGPTLDVIPYVSADEYSVQMNIIPTITEFVGYDSSGFQVQAQSVGSGAGGQLIQEVPLPRVRTRQVTTCCVVWDGQTVVLGGLISEDVQKIKDKVPVLGDLPLLGRAFRSESSIASKKNLLIFVTPTIIDPAGNRLHSEDEMPFAQGVVPSQRSVMQ